MNAPTAKPLDLAQFDEAPVNLWTGTQRHELLAECKRQREELAEWESALTALRINRDETLAAMVEWREKHASQREQIKALREALADMLNAHSVAPIMNAVQHYCTNRAAVQEASQARTKARALLAKVSP